MSGETTYTFLGLYEDTAPVLPFLSGFFQSPPRNFYNSEEVEIDVKRGGRDVAIVVTDLSTGYRMNESSVFTNKAFKPPVFKEAAALNSFDLLKRMPGQNPYQDPVYRADVLTRMLDQMGDIEAKIRRSIELQASQILTLGVLTLIDSSGNSLYSLDYQPKATHLPVTSVTWGGTSDTILADLESLADVVRQDGKKEPTDFIFGKTALAAFMADTTVLSLLDNRRLNLGSIGRPTVRGAGAKYHGDISIGSYTFGIWSYNEEYEHPQTGTLTKYVPDDKVICLCQGSRFDATFGAVPNIGKLLGVTGPGLFPEFPSRFISTARGMDLFTNIWLSKDGEQLFGGIASRPLLIPTAIDTYGCLTTTQA